MILILGRWLNLPHETKRGI